MYACLDCGCVDEELKELNDCPHLHVERIKVRKEHLYGKEKPTKQMVEEVHEQLIQERR